MLRYCEWKPGEDIFGGVPVLRLEYLVHDDKRIEVTGVESVISGTVPVYDVPTEMSFSQRAACRAYYAKCFQVSEAFQAAALTACTGDYLSKSAA